MKYLLLVRHSIAVTSLLDDFNRKLSNEGFTLAHKQGKLLSTLPVKFQIRHSAATRTTETAQIMEDYLSDGSKLISDLNLYNADLISIAEAIQEMSDSIDALAIVGHNPSMYEFAQLISKSKLREFNPASACFTKFSIDTWGEFELNLIEEKVVESALYLTN